MGTFPNLHLDLWEVVASHIYPCQDMIESVYPPMKDAMYWRIPRRTCLNLALTCKDLKEVGLSALWSKVPDLTFLIQCLPNDAWDWEEVPDTSANNTRPGIVMRRPITAKELEILRGYSWRIREYEEAKSRRFLLSPQVAQALQKLNRYKPLLPNLRSVTLRRTPREALAELLLSPKMRSVYLGRRYNDPPYTSYLKKVANLSCVTTLRLADEEQHYFAKGLLDPINVMVILSRMTNLISLSFENIELFTVVQGIAQFPLLKHLKITQPGNHFTPVPDLPVPFFPSLESLIVEGGDLSWPSKLLALFSQDSVLTEIKVQVMGSSHDKKPTGNWERILGAVNTFASQLRVLAIEDSSIAEVAEGYLPPMPASWLLQLCSLSNLVSLSLVYPGKCNVDDNTVQTLAGSLPRLKSFSLVAHFEGDIEGKSYSFAPKTTLQSLIALDQACPDLFKVTMCIDATSYQIPEIAPLSRSQLLELSIWHSVLDNPIPVANFFDEMFPNGIRLRILKVNPGFIEDWQEVIALINNT